MKKLISALLACVLIVGLAFTLVSCGNSLSGTYEGLLFDLKFKGEKVTIVVDGEDALSGTYEIKEDDDGDKTIAFDFVDEDEADEDEKKILKLIDDILGSDVAFEEDGDTIKIGKYIKASFTKK